MIIKYLDIPIIGDNEIAYFKLLEAVVNSVDELSCMEIRRNPKNYHFRIAPSRPLYLNMIVTELNNLHNLLHIQLEYSKSIKSSSSVAFNIPLTP